MSNLTKAPFFGLIALSLLATTTGCAGLASFFGFEDEAPVCSAEPPGMYRALAAADAHFTAGDYFAAADLYAKAAEKPAGEHESCSAIYVATRCSVWANAVEAAVVGRDLDQVSSMLDGYNGCVAEAPLVPPTAKERIAINVAAAMVGGYAPYKLPPESWPIQSSIEQASSR